MLAFFSFGVFWFFSGLKRLIANFFPYFVLVGVTGLLLLASFVTPIGFTEIFFGALVVGASFGLSYLKKRKEVSE